MPSVQFFFKSCARKNFEASEDAVRTRFQALSRCSLPRIMSSLVSDIQGASDIEISQRWQASPVQRRQELGKSQAVTESSSSSSSHPVYDKTQGHSEGSVAVVPITQPVSPASRAPSAPSAPPALSALSALSAPPAPSSLPTPSVAPVQPTPPVPPAPSASSSPSAPSASPPASTERIFSLCIASVSKVPAPPVLSAARKVPPVAIPGTSGASSAENVSPFPAPEEAKLASPSVSETSEQSIPDQSPKELRLSSRKKKQSESYSPEPFDRKFKKKIIGRFAEDSVSYIQDEPEPLHIPSDDPVRCACNSLRMAYKLLDRYQPLLLNENETRNVFCKVLKSALEYLKSLKMVVFCGAADPCENVSSF